MAIHWPSEMFVPCVWDGVLAPRVYVKGFPPNIRIRESANPPIQIRQSESANPARHGSAFGSAAAQQWAGPRPRAFVRPRARGRRLRGSFCHRCDRFANWLGREAKTSDWWFSLSGKPKGFIPKTRKAISVTRQTIMEASTPKWKTWFYLQRPSGSFHIT